MRSRDQASRALLIGFLTGIALVASGCYYHHFDLETVDHYSYRGRHHSVDADFYHGDGCDDW